MNFGRVNGEQLRTCGEQAIPFVPFFAITGARREVDGVTDNDGVLAAARTHDATPAQLRLAWTLSHGLHVLVIATRNPDHPDHVDPASCSLSSRYRRRLPA